MVSFPKQFKFQSPYKAPTIFRIFYLSLQTSQIPDDWRHAIVTPSCKSIPHNRPKPIQVCQSEVGCLQSAWVCSQRESACPVVLIFLIVLVKKWFHSPMLNRNQPVPGRKTGRKRLSEASAGGLLYLDFS